MLSTTQTTALERGTALFRAAGLRFAIEMPDLSIRGTLPVPKEAPAPVVARHHGPRLDPKYNYQARIDALQPGDVLIIDAENLDDALRLASVFASRAHQKFGSGNYISSRRALQLELLRVA